jgi:hypothetical protein
MRRFSGSLRQLWAAAGWEAVVVLSMLLLGLLARLPGLDQPFLDQYAFRQTETAYPALLFHQQGMNLFAPQLPVLGKPWQVPFEFPLFQAMAAVIMNAGVSPDLALRISSLICFMATAFAIWGLVRHLSSRTAAAITLVVFLAWPFNVYMSRESLIEYMATAFAVGYAWAGMVWIDTQKKRYAIIAVVLGALAMLVKLTSALFWIVPLLLYWRANRPLSDWRPWLRDRARTMLVLVPVPLIVGAAWTLHADSVKAMNPATRWLTSEALVTWNFGTLGQRLNLENWRTIAQSVGSLITGLPLWQLAVICVMALLRERRAVWLGVLLAGILPVVTFFNLYLIQDYYLAAITPALAAIVGYSIDGVVSRLRTLLTRAVGAAAIAVWLGITIYSAGHYLAPMYHEADPAQILPAAKELDAGTGPGDLIIFDGLDWSPAVPYYARRAGMMLPQPIVTRQLLDSLPSQGYRYLFTVTPQPGAFRDYSREVLNRWTWFDEVSPQLFRLGSSYASVSGGALAASSVPLAPTESSVSLLTAPKALPCGGLVTYLDVPPGAPVTLEFAATASVHGMSLEVNGHWIPAEPTVVVAPREGDVGLISLSCRGGIEVVLSNAFASHPR